MAFPTVKFKDNTTIVCTGATNSGKTFLIKRLLLQQKDMFETPLDKIVYCYTVHQPIFDEMSVQIPNITFHQGFPEVQHLLDICESCNHCAIIFDDMDSEVLQSEDHKNVFTRFCHHKGLTAILLCQNLFTQAKYAKTVFLNTHYFILLKSLRDSQQIICLSRQVFGAGDKSIYRSYQDCIKNKWGYLLVDLYPSSEDAYRLRTNIFPDELTYVYKRCK
jgi:hypothetical protein